MLGLSERVYQETREEALREGREEEARSLITRPLMCKLGLLPEALQTQVNELSLEELEVLGEALFDFADVSDLKPGDRRQASQHRLAVNQGLH